MNAKMQEQHAEKALPAWLDEVLTAKQLHPSHMMDSVELDRLQQTVARMGKDTPAPVKVPKEQLLAEFHNLFNLGVGRCNST